MHQCTGGYHFGCLGVVRVPWLTFYQWNWNLSIFFHFLFSAAYRTYTKISKTDLDVYAMFLPMAMFFYVLFYVSMPFNEERTEFKKMQPISPFIYWTSVFLFDAVIHSFYSYLIYLAHIWCDVHHIFDTREYGMWSLQIIGCSILSPFGPNKINEIYLWMNVSFQWCSARSTYAMVLHIYQSSTWSVSCSAQCPAFIHSSPICLWFSVSEPNFHRIMEKKCFSRLLFPHLRTVSDGRAFASYT